MAPPSTILDLKAELLLGTLGWTDISHSVYQSKNVAGAVITRGHADESTRTNPSSALLALKNGDGRFSSRNPAGPYYGQLVKNTQVRVSVPEGASYLRSETDQASYASAPNSAGLQITGDMEIQIDLTLDNWNANQVLAGKWNPTGDQRTWVLELNEDGTLSFSVSTLGTSPSVSTAASTVPVPVPGLGRQAIKVTLATASGNVTFYTAPAALNQAPLGPITTGWVQLGAVVTPAVALTPFASTAQLSVGWVAASGAPFGYPGVFGKVHAFRLLQGIGGTVKASPDFTAQTAGVTSFADAQSNTWTLQGTAEISNRRYRAHAEVASWPQAWDKTGTDVWVSVTANGLLRRLNQGYQPLDSAMRRYWKKVTGSLAPAAYWPCEEKSGRRFASGLTGENPMYVIAGSPNLASGTPFACSDALPALNGSTWKGRVPAYSGTDAIVSCLVSFPAGGDTLNGVVAALSLTGGTAALVWLHYDPSFGGGGLSLIAYDAGGSQIALTSTITGLNGTSFLLRFGARKSGADVIYTLSILPPGGAVTTVSSTVTTATVGNAVAVTVNSGQDSGAFLSGTLAGHIAVQGTWDPLSSFTGTPNVVTGWAGEPAGSRFSRLCGEEGIAFRGQGRLSATVPMGAQTQQVLTSLLQECADADRGQIYEPREVLGLGYRTLASLRNQSAAVALDYALAHLSGDLTPADDDQATANDVTAARTGGSSARLVQAAGPLSVQAPPNGVGAYAVSPPAVNVQSDSQCLHQAGWSLHLGTVDENRYPLIQLTLSRSVLTGLYYDLQDADLGDRVTVANPPAWLPPGAISQLIQQTVERLGGYMFEIDWTGVPASPYATAVVAFKPDTDGSTLHTGITSGATTLTADSTGMPWTNTAVPFDIAVRPSNVSAGERMTVTAVTGSSVTGAFLNDAAMGEPSYSQAVTDWNTWTGKTLKVTRAYYGLSSFPTVDAKLTYAINNGIKVCLNLSPAFNPTSATDRTNLGTMLTTWKSAGLNAEVSLWAEPFNAGLTSTQFQAMIAFYGPTVRASYPLVFCTSALSVQNNAENTYYTSDADFDKIATDLYAIRWVSGTTLDLAASIADHAVPPKPFGLWEFNGSPAGANFLTGDNVNFEGSIGTWTAAGNSTIAQTAAQAHAGTKALAITSVAAGDATAAHCAAANITTQGLPCAPGDPIVTSAFVRSAVSARSVAAGATFYTSGGVLISSIFGNSVTDNTTGWVNPVDNGLITAPATSAFCRLAVKIIATGAASEVHYTDDCSIGNSNTGQSQSQISSYFSYLQRYFTGRLSAGQQNADLILFNSGSVGNYGIVTPIVSAGDFRVALWNTLYTALNSTSSPQTFTVTRSVNGVARAHTAGEAITLFTPATVPLA